MEKQKNGIKIGGKCTACVVISNRLRLHAKRESQGLAPVPIRDSSFCHVCNIPKINGRCIPCRRRMAAERKAKKREEAGKRPWGIGRPETCYKCGVIKENKDHAYCKTCKSLDDKIRWQEVIAPRVNRKERSNLCACGNEKAPYNVSYCKSCIAKQVRDRRARAKELKPIVKVLPLTKEEKKLRRDARALTNSALRRGILTRGPCEVCGTDMVEAHHDDYYKALDVKWLCKQHHDEHHKNNPNLEK